MRPPVVMDSNVAFVGNGRADHAEPDCVLACVARMERIKTQERLLLDSEGRILQEYPSPRPTEQPRAGDAFIIWAWQNQHNPEVCTLVPIQAHDKRGFAQFPDDEELAGFDRDDRKFVAVAVASGESPPILNASDTDWRDHQQALSRHGVAVEFVCPELMNAPGP